MLPSPSSLRFQRLFHLLHRFHPRSKCHSSPTVPPVPFEAVLAGLQPPNFNRYQLDYLQLYWTSTSTVSRSWILSHSDPLAAFQPAIAMAASVLRSGILGLGLLTVADCGVLARQLQIDQQITMPHPVSASSPIYGRISIHPHAGPAIRCVRLGSPMSTFVWMLVVSPSQFFDIFDPYQKSRHPKLSVVPERAYTRLPSCAFTLSTVILFAG
jgi:hypothetical protein